MEDIYLQLVLLAASAVIFKMFLQDLRSKSGVNKGFAGATYAPIFICMVGIVGSIFILALSTLSEKFFGVSSDQSEVAYYAVVFWIAAAFIEELIFRGYFFVDKKGKATFIASIIIFSLIFTLAHPFFKEYSFDEIKRGEFFTLKFTTHAWISSITIFTNSLFYYYLRFTKLNPKKSLIPCVVAHLSYNVGVYVVKFLEGYVIF